MAHAILDKPTGINLSSALREISVNADGDSVDVMLTGAAGEILFKERFYPFNGVVKIHDLASIIEADMRPAGVTYAQYTLKVYTDTPTNKADSHTFKVLYCDRFALGSDTDLFLLENYLSTLDFRRIAEDSVATLPLFAKSGEALAYSVAYKFRIRNDESILMGEMLCAETKTAEADGVSVIRVPVSSIVEHAATAVEKFETDITPLCFTVTCGQRSATFFIDTMLRDRDSFFFRNCFNVWDGATLPVVTTAKTDVDRSTASLNGRSLIYNRDVSRTYESEIGPLTSDEAGWIDQLFSSHDVRRIERDLTDDENPYILADILITDSDCQMKDGDDAVNSAKITWRYADNRPPVRLSASPGIFTSPFDFRYS